MNNFLGKTNLSTIQRNKNVFKYFCALNFFLAMTETDKNKLKDQIHEIIFEADTPMGKLFDIVLLVLIIASVLAVMLETVPGLEETHKRMFLIFEWIFTIIFTIEYAMRLYCVRNPVKYAKSFYGIIDLVSILPTYLSLIVFDVHSLMIVRALRLLRVFRIFKLGHFMSEGQLIINALKASRAKISVFLFFILIMTTIMGSVMYLIESPQRGGHEGFNSIPNSIYWAIVTLTTVGYGDISPITPLGKFVSALLMILGYSVIAVPTGIVSSELTNGSKPNEDVKYHNTQVCRFCAKEGHDDDAEYCKYCGEILNEEEENKESDDSPENSENQRWDF